jgi:hypothetical protein
MYLPYMKVTGQLMKLLEETRKCYRIKELGQSSDYMPPNNVPSWVTIHPFLQKMVI